jgi:RsiW-degrading membrane proteinase PrsW (M82 family)
MAVSSVIGFAPAILLLYILLRQYETFFTERNIFLALAGGMVLGMVITVFHLASDDTILDFLDLSLIVYVLLFALFEELAKLIILNYPKLAGKHYTVYYGATLGLGVGSMAIIAISYKLFLDSPNALGNPVTVGVLVVLSFNYSLLNGSTGVMIGYGSAKYKLSNYFIRAFLVHALFNLMLLPFLWGLAVAEFGSLFLITLFTVSLFWYVLKTLMPDAVPLKMQKKRRRESRKRVREKRTKKK